MSYKKVQALPISQQPCSFNPMLTQMENTTSIRNVRYAGNKLDGNAIGILGDIYGDLHLHSHQSDQPHRPFSTVPFNEDPDFVDRPDALAWVYGKCTIPGGRAALVGLGGVGKSQIAIQYAHNIFRTEQPIFVFWVYASSRTTFEHAYRQLAERLKLPGRDNPATDTLRLVSNWLCDEGNGKWTMILDNVDDIDIFFQPLNRQATVINAPSTSLAAYLPQSRNGSILITSRNKDVANRLTGSYKNIREVSTMDHTQAFRLLQNKLQDEIFENEDTINLLKTLDCMPLAISQAAAYINRRARITISDYVAEFHKNNKKRKGLLASDLGDIRRDQTASNSVVITWQISFDHIREQRQSAADLLSLMSFFKPQDIPQSVLRRRDQELIMMGWGNEDNDKNHSDENDDEYEEDFETLRAYSLVAETAQPDMCEMHALVQFCTQVWLSSCGVADEWNHKFVELMAREFPTGESEDWAKCQKLLPHVLPLCDTQPDAEDLLKRWTQLLMNTAWFMWMRGNFTAAEDITTKALIAREEAMGLDDERTLETITLLAIVQQDQGNYNEAERLNRRALEQREKTLGLNHPATLTSVSNLAWVMRDQGKYEAAEELNRRALEGYTKGLGLDNLSTLTSINNLATVLHFKGNISEAEQLYSQALESRHKAQGLYHHDTLMNRNNLALALTDQGKYVEAEDQYRQALAGFEKELGMNHPSALMVLSNLAWLLLDQGNDIELEILARRTVGERDMDLPTDHLTKSSNNSESIYQSAEKLHRRVLEIRTKNIGLHHPDTLKSMESLAGVLAKQEKYREAEKLHCLVLEGREERLGMQHPDTLESLKRLALLLRSQEKIEESARLFYQALTTIQGSEQTQEFQHLNILRCVRDFLRTTQGRLDEPEKLARQALDVCEKKLGSDHLHTLMSTDSLAFVLRDQKKYEEAEILCRKALEGRERELGSQHPATLDTKATLESILRGLGKKA